MYVLVVLSRLQVKPERVIRIVLVTEEEDSGPESRFQAKLSVDLCFEFEVHAASVHTLSLMMAG